MHASPPPICDTRISDLAIALGAVTSEMIAFFVIDGSPKLLTLAVFAVIGTVAAVRAQVLVIDRLMPRASPDALEPSPSAFSGT